MLSRREFLRRSILFTMGSALAACAPRDAPTPTPAPTSAPTPTAPPVPTATRAIPTAAPSPTAAPTMTATPVPPSAAQPYLTVARGASPAAITRAAIDALGGMSRFVKKGNDVIIKPNICNASIPPELASTTNPEVVAEIVKLCLDAGAARVRVMDQPFSGTAAEAYKRSGIREAVERAGGQMEIMSAMKYITANFAAPARDLKTWKVYQDILKADVVINLPVAKTHNLAKLTLGMKGLMGVILDREDFHPHLDQRVADLNTLIHPTLTVIDGVRVVIRNGPTTWRPEDVVVGNTVIASHDIVAADAFAAQTLFQKKPDDIGYIKLGAAMGLGRYDFGNLRVKEVLV
jgi:uncharacterized protein (DUF362 family)